MGRMPTDTEKSLGVGSSGASRHADTEGKSIGGQGREIGESLPVETLGGG